MTLHRRDLLGLFGAGAAGAAAPAAAHTVPSVVFLHGVASGDPRADGMVIWTRVTPSDPTSGRLELDEGANHP
jgi:alkaline phosphatase D